MNRRILLGMWLLHVCCVTFASQEKQITRADLHTAIIQNNIDQIRSFLVNGGDVNIRDGCGDTMLQAVSGLNMSTMEKMLVEEYKADVNAENNWNRTPLMNAAWMGRNDTVEYLLEKGAFVNAQDVEGDTALKRLISLGHYDIAEILIANKANVNLADNTGRTPLMIAAKNDEARFVDLLLENGAYVSIDKNNNTTITHAVMDPALCVPEWLKLGIVHKLLFSQNIKREIRKQMCETRKWIMEDNDKVIWSSLPREVMQEISRAIIKPVIVKERTRILDLLGRKNKNGKIARDYAQTNKLKKIVQLFDAIGNDDIFVKVIGRLLLGDNPPEHIIPILPYEFEYKSVGDREYER